MSLYGLHLAAKHLRDEEAALDRWCDKQLVKRNEKVEGEELEKAAKELYEKIRAVAMKHIGKLSAGHASVPLKTHPNCVVKRVQELFAEREIKTKHSYNDGTPSYDYFEINLSTLKV